LTYATMPGELAARTAVKLVLSRSGS